MRTWTIRIVSWLAAALVGAVYGVAGTIAHSLSWGPLPVGLVVGAVACGALLIAVRALTHDRAATLATALGMLGMLLVISGPGPGGSVVVPATASGQIWVYLVAGLALATIVWPAGRHDRGRSRRAGEQEMPDREESTGIRS